MKKDYTITKAKKEDLKDIWNLQQKCQKKRYATPNGTPYLKKLPREKLEELIPSTLVLKYQGTVQGKIHWDFVETMPGVAAIGGFAIHQDHQGFRMGGELFKKALGILKKKGIREAISITASPSVQKFYRKFHGTQEKRGKRGKWKIQLLQSAQKRYGTDADQVKIFTFRIEKPV